jgi:hypothetical protein
MQHMLLLLVDFEMLSGIDRAVIEGTQSQRCHYDEHHW